MIAIETILEIGLLWFLIVYFTGSEDAEQSCRETVIVIFGVMFAGLVANAVLGESLSFLAVPIKLVALYYLVDWSCGVDRRTTLKIGAWHLVLSIMASLAMPFLVETAGE